MMAVRKKKIIDIYLICAIMISLLVLGLSIQVVANQPPIADAEPDNQTIYAGEEAWFNGSESYDPDGSIESYFWNFQDGTFSLGSNTSRVYDIPGNYTVILTVTDDMGATDDDIVNVTVLESPPSTTTVWINSLSTDKQGYNVAEAINADVVVKRDYGNFPPVWEGTLIFEVFDDNMVLSYYDERQVILPDIGAASISSFNFNLTEGGEYLVRASLYDNANIFVDSKETSIVIFQESQNQLPVAIVNSDHQIVNVSDTIWFYGHLSYDPDGLIVSYDWDFGDGNTGTGSEISHVYEIAGNFTVTLIVIDDEGAKDQDTVEVRVKELAGEPDDGNETPPPTGNSNRWNIPLILLAISGFFAALATLYKTETGRYMLFSLFLPLYTKLKRKEILDHFTRGKIFGYILANPGDHYSSIKKALELSNGVFSYHLHILEKEGIIKSAREGTYKCFYPSGMRIPSSEGSLKKSQLIIIEKIKEMPGISQKDIAALLGVSSATINYHIKELIKLGIIKVERKGMRLKYYFNTEKEEIEREAKVKSKLEAIQKKKLLDAG
jgi:PKD repeat protein/DNA-binding MarR family transcriptional regulator